MSETLCLFFFSSRRRHTRCSRDWSSDVCSSDLRSPRPDRAREQTARDSSQQSHRPHASICKRSFSPFRSRPPQEDRKSTRLNSSHGYISYAVFCLKKKTTPQSILILT